MRLRSSEVWLNKKNRSDHSFCSYLAHIRVMANIYNKQEKHISLYESKETISKGHHIDKFLNLLKIKIKQNKKCTHLWITKWIFLHTKCVWVCVGVRWGRYFEISWGSHEQVREWAQWGRSIKNSRREAETSLQSPWTPGALWSISDSGLKVFAKRPLVTRGNGFLRKLIHCEKVCFEKCLSCTELKPVSSNFYSLFFHLPLASHQELVHPPTVTLGISLSSFSYKNLLFFRLSNSVASAFPHMAQSDDHSLLPESIDRVGVRHCILFIRYIT